LALAADVSARHISFLESGRAKPSEEMVLRLMSTLEVPLRDQNDVLRAASYAARFVEPSFAELEPAIERAIGQMLDQQEPYPMTIMDAGYDILRSNQAAITIFSHFTAEPARQTSPANLYMQVFDPKLSRPFIKNWTQLGQLMISRLHREVLRRPGEVRLGKLLERVLALPDVPKTWRHPDFAKVSEATATLVLERGSLKLQFLLAATVFSAPQLITLEELLIESYFPIDEQTKRSCEEMRAVAASISTSLFF
jgi:transcriptional regulator with XRE-family HTH domain